MTELIQNPASLDSCFSVLSSYNLGGGNTAELAKQFDFVSDGTLVNVLTNERYNIELSVLQAIAIHSLHKSDANLRYASYGYLGKKHYDAVNRTDKTSATKNPLKKVGKILSSHDYAENCVSINKLTADKEIVLTALRSMASIIEGIENKKVKSELLVPFNAIFAQFLTQENTVEVAIIVENEAKDLELFNALSSAGFTNLSRNTDDTFNASIDGAHLGTMQGTLSTNNLVLGNSFVNNATNQIDIVFSKVDGDD